MSEGGKADGPMRIYAFVESYPHAYKPYYDVQFEDFVRAGHTLRIFGTGTAHAGDLTERTRQLVPRFTPFPPNAFRALPRHLGGIASGLFSSPARRLAAATDIRRRNYRGLRSATEAGRMLTMPGVAPDVCLVHGIGPMSLLLWLKVLYPDAVVAMYYHGGRPAEAGELSRPLPEIFGAADVVFTNTDASAQQAVRDGCAREKIHVVPVGLDVSDYPMPADRSYRDGDVLRLVSVGRLSEGKGIDDALQAVSSFVRKSSASIRYAIIGDGPERSRLEALSSSLGLSDVVTFHGALSNHDVAAEVLRADAMILASVTTPSWAETQAVVLQEAMLLGTAVITTRSGGIPESIAPVMQRFSASERDRMGLERALQAVASLTVGELAEIGAAAREWTIERYDIRHTNERLLNDVRAIRDRVTFASESRST